MTFLEIYLSALAIIITFMTLLWLLSVAIRNVSIVDLFWGFGFIISAAYYYFVGEGNPERNLLLLILVAIWGLRLTIYLMWRNIGKGEDFRYQEFRRSYGDKRYWWISFFQTFLLQGVLMWLISAPLLGAMHYGRDLPLGFFDGLAVVVWLTGFIFEAGGDLQLARFKGKPENKGKVLDTGFWKYTRHPNYFGDSAVWWAYGLFAIAAGAYLTVLGSILMTLIIIRVSGVSLLEKTLKTDKPEYADYIRRTSAFFPMPPKKRSYGMDYK
jgi:steroid 5-alpha reductase family enzyme